MGGQGVTNNDVGGALPPLPASDLAALRASIAADGVKVPVVVDERGAIIDGRHRTMIAKDLGISYQRYKAVLDDLAQEPDGEQQRPDIPVVV